jgi:glycerophosphoryl diester phosphodiesterase
VQAQASRLASIDGSSSDRNKDLSKHLMPRVSAHYNSVFNWKGQGSMPRQEQQVLQQIVSEAHAHERKVRFWAMPHEATIWQTFLDAGVDWINVDDLAAFRAFYVQYESKAKPLSK